jgi:L-alanine-DL-glutamate epimerase-like enolase superfamily enzyme
VADVMIEKMKAHPSPVYKVKFTKAADIDLLRALRQHTTAPFRIDANESLLFDDIKALLPELQSLGVDMIEQPLPKTEWEAMKELRAISTIPLFADESCVEEEDVALCADSFHGINIKLTKCGGITPALRMIQDARKRGLKVMLGTMNESTIGSAALAHIAPVVDALDADGPLLLKEDVADGLRYNNGTIQISGAPGLGIRLRGEKFATK